MTIDALHKFEWVARNAAGYAVKSEVQEEDTPGAEHPFDSRSIHPELWKHSKKLFDDGHYSQATFEAFKYIDKKVKKLSKTSETGFKLMMKAFNVDHPVIKLADTSDSSGADEQKGYSFLFSGGVMAIRNPRGHEVELGDTIEECLDHLSFASLLLRKLDQRLEPKLTHPSSKPR